MGTWYRGGVQTVYNQSFHWGTDDIRCALVATSPINVIDTQVSLQDFLNTPNTLIASTRDTNFTGALTFRWTNLAGDAAPPSGEYQFFFNGQVDFGIVAPATNYGGVVVYEKGVDDANSPVYIVQQTPGTAQGGNVTWGAAGDNRIGRWTSTFDTSDGGVLCFQGTLEDVISGLTIANSGDIWEQAVNLGFALERDTSGANPNGTERFMSEIDALTPQWVTNGAPGDVTMPINVAANRIDLASASSYLLRRLGQNESGAAAQWDDADMTDGQIIKRVWTFLFQGAYNAATAVIYSAHDMSDPGFTIPAGQNIIYGDNQGTTRVTNTSITH